MLTRQPDTVGLHGAFSATERGQPMQVYRRASPFFPLDPHPEDLDLSAIAHALSLQCRFGGHIREFYSVAQHCIEVSHLCENYPLEGLMHDASEAYLGDIVKPLKSLFPAYAEGEAKMEQAIASRWGLAWPWPEEVKRADLVMLSTEKRDLLDPSDQDWGPMPEPIDWRLSGWTPRVAERLFLERARSLGLE